MKPTAEERREANRKRRDEYKTIRDRMAWIATAEPAAEITDRDRIEAAKIILQIDRDGVPPVYKW